MWQIKSILKKINILRGTLNAEDAMAKARNEAEIARLRQEMIECCGGVVPTALNLD